jgi:perosamine synthetase
MEHKQISIFSPHIKKDIIEEVKNTLESGWINVGEKVYEFENNFAKKFDMKYAVSVNSCTAALRLAYAIAGVRPGSEVITTPFTMIATNTAILEQFGKPVFADTQYETANIDPSDIEHRITEKTKAIVCTHNLGYPCDLNELEKIATKHNLFLVEDAAHAIGAKYQSKYIGSNSDFACFSFAAAKHITTGDGGMFVTNNEKFYEEALRGSFFGMDRKKRDEMGYYPLDIVENGFKMRMNNIVASMGNAQLKYIDEILSERKKKAKKYDESLKGINGITLMQYKSDRESAYYLYPIHAEKRLDFVRMMKVNGIETYAQNFRNDRLTIFEGYRNDLPNTEKIDKDFICLPIHQDVSLEDVDYIVETIKKGW